MLIANSKIAIPMLQGIQSCNTWVQCLNILFEPKKYQNIMYMLNIILQLSNIKDMYAIHLHICCHGNQFTFFKTYQEKRVYGHLLEQYVKTWYYVYRHPKRGNNWQNIFFQKKKKKSSLNHYQLFFVWNNKITKYK